MTKTAKALPTSKTVLDDFNLGPTNQPNRATMKRLHLDMPSADLRAFRDQAQAQDITMRRYFYQMWDAYTNSNRSASVFDD